MVLVGRLAHLEDADVDLPRQSRRQGGERSRGAGLPLPAELDGLSAPLVVGLTISPEPLVQIRMNRLRQLRLENDARTGGRPSRATTPSSSACARSWSMRGACSPGTAGR